MTYRLDLQHANYADGRGCPAITEARLLHIDGPEDGGGHEQKRPRDSIPLFGGARHVDDASLVYHTAMESFQASPSMGRRPDLKRKLVVVGDGARQQLYLGPPSKAHFAWTRKVDAARPVS